MKLNRRILIVGIVLSSVTCTFAQTDHLPSWNDGASKRAIIDFVNRVRREGGPYFVPVSQYRGRDDTQ